MVLAMDLGKAFEREASSFTHPGAKNDLVVKRGRRLVIDLVAQYDPADRFLRFWAGECSPMGDGNILDPAQVNGVVHMVLLVNVARQNRDGHFERR